MGLILAATDFRYIYRDVNMYDELAVPIANKQTHYFLVIV